MNAYSDTNPDDRNNILSVFKEEIILKNKAILQKCKVPNYYGTYSRTRLRAPADCPS